MKAKVCVSFHLESGATKDLLIDPLAKKSHFLKVDFQYTYVYESFCLFETETYSGALGDLRLSEIDV